MIKNKNRGRFKTITNPVLKQGPTTATIRVQLDSRTVITLHSLAALALWKDRYPNAKVL